VYLKYYYLLIFAHFIIFMFN